ncbi:MAG TPA: hypothetical protein VJH23_00400 [archaeon]|nr:hypothetical protein [archaeon]
MRRIFYFRVAGSDVHLPKLIGAFIMFATALLFVQASSTMFDSWDTMKYYDKCILGINTNESISDQRAQFSNCADTLYRSTGIVTRLEHPLLTQRQFAIGLLGPMGALLLWLAVFFVGYTLYRTDKIILPIEERVRDLPDFPKSKFAYKRKR